MKLIKPKGNNKEKVTWSVSTKTKLIVSYYAQFTQYDEDEVVDIILQNILEDKDFVEWLNKRRSKKKIESIIFENLEEISPKVTEGDTLV